MHCPKCNQPLIIAKTTLPYSAIASTDVYTKHTFACTNQSCENYCGTDLANPRVVVGEKEIKLN